MAKKLKGDVKGNKRGPQSTYDWDTWLDGNSWQLKRGVDFDTPVEKMRIRVWNVSSQRGLSVRTEVVDSDTLLIQVVAR